MEIINRPAHYTAGGLEAQDVMRAKLNKVEWQGYLKGSCLKYLLRANFKEEHDTDIRKAAWFMARLEETIDERLEDAPKARNDEAFLEGVDLKWGGTD